MRIVQAITVVAKLAKSFGCHYNRNAETYMLVGESLGQGMIKLLTQFKK
ncbi:MAG: hypothetical protein H8E44_25030 [Planctomycetes bacterium]|nr:hypothetical protein [Planctomycetota bacterium]MBL7043020.1 hypothetical protein [Pirellulaceae bacterium]